MQKMPFAQFAFDMHSTALYPVGIKGAEEKSCSRTSPLTGRWNKTSSQGFAAPPVLKPILLTTISKGTEGFARDVRILVCVYTNSTSELSSIQECIHIYLVQLFCSKGHFGSNRHDIFCHCAVLLHLHGFSEETNFSAILRFPKFQHLIFFRSGDISSLSSPHTIFQHLLLHLR